MEGGRMDGLYIERASPSLDCPPSLCQSIPPQATPIQAQLPLPRRPAPLPGSLPSSLPPSLPPSHPPLLLYSLRSLPSALSLPPSHPPSPPSPVPHRHAPLSALPQQRRHTTDEVSGYDDDDDDEWVELPPQPLPKRSLQHARSGLGMQQQPLLPRALDARQPERGR